MSVLASRRKPLTEETREYARLRRVVLNGVRSRLRQHGLRYDELDLEGFYNAAWHALHVRLSAGEEITNPEGFLIKVACRRAIDDARRMRGLDRDPSSEVDEQGVEPDIAEQLDHRTLLRHFREGLKEKLTERECQAATLCLIIGYTRPQAADMLGISPKRMERIMDDAQRKIGAFEATITEHAWCASHESLMRAYAVRVLNEQGDRYKLARAHLGECPACRRFVLFLRHVAVVVPPVALPLKLAGPPAATLAHLNRAIHHAWRHKINLIGSHVASTKSGAGAGAGLGGGAGVGSTLVGSGIGAKTLAFCVAVCLAGGAVVVGVGGHHAPSHRKAQVAAHHGSAPSAARLLTAQPAAPARCSPAAPNLHRAARTRQLTAARPAPQRTSAASARSSPSSTSRAAPAQRLRPRYRPRPPK
jgi:DNA-directed RNA polymerase specialized sigma24 family protein